MLHKTQITNIQEMPTPRGVAWTADVLYQKRIVAKLSNKGDGSATAFYRTSDEWKTLYPALEAHARAKLNIEYEALDLLCAGAQNDQPLSEVEIF